jgi:hypothetical protein
MGGWFGSRVFAALRAFSFLSTCQTPQGKSRVNDYWRNIAFSLLIASYIVCVCRTWKESSASPELAVTRLLGSRSKIPTTRRLSDAQDAKMEIPT